MGHWNRQTLSVPFPSLFGDCQDQGVKGRGCFEGYVVLMVGSVLGRVQGRGLEVQWVARKVLHQE